MDTIKPLFTATATATGGRNGHTVEHLSRRPTYEFQLEAFCRAVASCAWQERQSWT